MDQSSKIAGFTIAAFIVFITVRGELPLYMGFLLGSNSGTAAPSQSASASGIPAQAVTAVVDTLLAGA